MNYYQQQPYMGSYNPYTTQNSGYQPQTNYPNYSQPILQNQVAQPQAQPVQQQQQTVTMPVLNGKIVESADIARLQEIPYKSMAVFPRGDMKEIYVKCYDDDGYPKLITYREFVDPVPATQENVVKDNHIDEMLQSISNEIAVIKEKITAFAD